MLFEFYLFIPCSSELLAHFWGYIWNFVVDLVYVSFSIILQEMLPEYIHMRVAESILFAGKAVRVLRNPSPAFRFKDATQHLQIPKGSQRIQGLMGCFSFHRELFMDTELIGEELLPQSEADKIESMLQNLKVPTSPLLISITY